MQLLCQIQLPDQSSLDRDVRGSSIRIGRGASCELCITGHAGDVVSELHARLEQTSKGLLLTDLQSSNGTYLNDQKVEKPVMVQEGDLIRLGKQGPRLLLKRVDLLENGEPRVLEPLVVGGPTRMGNGAWGASAAQRRPSLVHPLPGTPAAAEPYSGPVLPLPVSPAEAAPVSEAGSATRGLVVEMQQQQKRFASTLGLAGGAALLVVFSALLAVGIYIWGGWVSTAQGGDIVFKKLLRASVWVVHEIESSDKEDIRKFLIKGGLDPTKIPPEKWPTKVPIGTATGSGVLVDLSRKLAVTNFHVIAHNGIPAKQVKIYFPEFVNGVLDQSRESYEQHSRAIGAKVVVSEATCDLAVLELDSIPESAISVPLAKRSSLPGQQVFSIGNPAVGRVLWIFSSGKVRAVVREEQNLVGSGEAYIQQVNARVLKTEMPINQGDSGGPVCNDLVELVGINSSGKNPGEANLMTHAIDIQEVKRMLNLANVPNTE